MCSACYQRWWRGSPAIATQCCVCGEHDNAVLRSFRLATGNTVATCWNCGHVGDKARPRPSTVEDLRTLRQRRGDRRELGRDRRQADRRNLGWNRRDDERSGGGDRRVLRHGEGDRREADRRAS